MEKFTIIIGAFNTTLFLTFLENDPDILVGGSISVLGLAALLYFIPTFRKLIGVPNDR